MQKKIIALAVASALTMPAVAMAEATVYGQVRMAYEMIDDGGDGAGVGLVDNSRNRVSSNASRLGVKGSEDLGGGMSFVWQMEGDIFVDTGGTTAGRLFNRNTFAGLGTSFGTVVLGNHDTPYKMVTRGMDVFIDSIADNRSVMGANLLDYRASDVLAYLTPNWGGFSGAIAIVGETDNTLPTQLTAAAGPAAKTGATTLSAKYGMDKWSAVFGYINVKGSDNLVPADAFTATGTKVGGTFATDTVTVNAIYEMISLKVNAPVLNTESKQNNIYVAGVLKVGAAGAAKLAVTKASNQKVAGVTQTSTGATQLALGYDHALTKNTTVFGLYTAINNGTNSAYGFTSGGSTGVTPAGTTLAGPRGDLGAFAVGIRHSF